MKNSTFFIIKNLLSFIIGTELMMLVHEICNNTEHKLYYLIILIILFILWFCYLLKMSKELDNEVVEDVQCKH